MSDDHISTYPQFVEQANTIHNSYSELHILYK